jgi:hypothetical protein
MSKSIRIRTTPNGDDKYLKVKLEQDFDLLEILSLKLTQEEVYKEYCSSYGVVAGRVSVNNGFGIPNVKVSIFIPVSDEDRNDEVIGRLYPFRSPNERGENGVRYNLLPSRQQTKDHTPIGTFPDKREVLDDETYIEVYEKYYKYTTRTNESGDFMLYGVPVGDHTLHYDVDVSDIGFLSARPYELINQGIAKEKFQSEFKFKQNRNLDNLPQVRSGDLSVTVQPFWCDTLNDTNEVGVTRRDIPIDDYELIPTAIFMGSLYSDDENDSINKNCRPRRKTGDMQNLITSSGKIEIIRRTPSGNIEKYEDLGEDLIDENGNWAFLMPMNLRKLVTAEDGTLIPSSDGESGVASEADVRFRISMNPSGNEKRIRTRAKMLVPNMNSNYNFGKFNKKDLQDAYDSNNPIFDINDEISLAPDEYADDITNEYNYLKDFFTFRWKKVYTIRQYIGRYQKNRNDENRNFVGIKDIARAEGINKIPYNRVDTRFSALYTVLCSVLTFFYTVVAAINCIINTLNGIINALCNIRIPFGICAESARGATVKIRYDIQTGNGGTGSGGWDNGQSNKKSQRTDVLDMGYISEGDYESGLTLNCNDIDEFFNSPYINGSVTNSIPRTFTSYNGWAELNPSDKSGDGQTEVKGIKGRWPEGCNDCPDCFLGSTQNCFCPSGPPFGANVHTWCYNFGSCYYNTINNDTIAGGCKRWRFADSNMGNSLDNCDKKTDDDKKQECQDDPDALYFLGVCWRLKWKCILGGICDSVDGCDCQTISDPAICGGDSEGCCEGGCCEIIPQIRIKCPGDELGVAPSLCSFGGCGDEADSVCLTNCNGLRIESINELVQCQLSGLASLVGLMKLDFYNDWMNGALYFPLIKRKYKTKKAKKKFGLIRKDKFCDFDCWENPDNIIGTSNSQPGVDSYYLNNDSGPNGPWDLYPVPGQTNIFNPNTDDKIRIRDREHGKPLYSAITVSEIGLETYINVRGHGHHQNRCNDSNLVERKEFVGHPYQAPIECNVGVDNPLGDILCNNLCSGGIKGCGQDFEFAYNKNSVKNGMIKWYDGEIYYATVIDNELIVPDDDDYQVIKSKLLYPTNITELGSTSFCDIDDAPFIMDKLETTSYKVSEGQAGDNVNLKPFADIGCAGIDCLNVRNISLASQLGVDLIDYDDEDELLTNCKSYFDHDEEIREYICGRFTTYKNDNLDINYKLPSISSNNNIYEFYENQSLPVNNNAAANPANGTVNDGDGITYSDWCRMVEFDGTPKQYGYFYGNNYPQAAYNPSIGFTYNGDNSSPTEYSVSFSTSHTPFYFYFGVVPGKTALDKAVSKYFADKVNDTTALGIIGSGEDNDDLFIPPDVNEQSPASILASCLNR